MTTDLRERLHDLAADAPTGHLVGAALWRSGVRRHRLRVAGAVAGAAAAVALVAGLVTVVPTAQSPDPAGQTGSLGIPRVVRPPDPWSEPTRTPGPLAALSAEMHRTPDGLTGSRDRMTLFGVSAVDGVSRFLDLPGRLVNVDPGSVAVSADGTQVAMTRDRGRTQVGWDVLDTVSGEVTELRLPGDAPVRSGWGYEIRFTADGGHLVTNFSLDGERGDTDDSLVAWDLATGEPVEVEGPGHYWIPGSARGPEGVAWTRRRDVHVADPETGEQRTERLPHQLVDASYAADGETLAYIGHEQQRAREDDPWLLYLRRPGEPSVQVDVGIEPGQILGWRSDDELVVSRYGPREARVVDLATGTWEPLDLSARVIMTAQYPTALWSRPLAEPVDQPEAGDPRPWMDRQVQWIAVGLLLGGLLQVWLVVRRRRG
jgi:hypothetical protein